MTHEPDDGFPLLSVEDDEKLGRILSERSQGAYEMATLHGMITASVVGPAPIPLDWVAQTVLDGPDEENGFDQVPEFSWVEEKAGEIVQGISRGLQQEPRVHLAIGWTKEKGEKTPD